MNSKKKSKKSKATKKKLTDIELAERAINREQKQLQNWLKQKIRRISYMWPPMKQAVQKARVSRGKYRCASCGGENFGPKEIQRDHIKPVIDPIKGFTNWEDYITRLFCSVDGIAILCLPCHETKTFRENLVRKQIKQENDPEEEI